MRRILDAQEAGKLAEARAIRQEARARGVTITNDMLTGARQSRGKTTLEQTLQGIPRRERRQIEERVQSKLPLREQ